MTKTIRFDFQKDNYYAEVKESEIMQGRMNMLQLIDPYVGKYYSVDWVRKNVLMQDEEEIKEIDKQIEDEREFVANMEADKQESNMQQEIDKAGGKLPDEGDEQWVKL